jgi:peroxisomal membrane protein 2
MRNLLIQIISFSVIIHFSNGFVPVGRCKMPSTKLHMDTTPLTEAWTAYNNALVQDPLITKSVTASVILGAADLTGQILENSKKSDDDDTPIDPARVARFALFGLILQAPWNHYYYLYLDGVLPPTEDPFTATTGIKVIIDQFVQAPIFTVIIFVFLGLLEGKSIDDIKSQLDADYKDTMLANWKLWVPATMVNLAFCPPVLRVLFLNCVFFFWSIFLSLKLNSDSGGNASTESK